MIYFIIHKDNEMGYKTLPNQIRKDAYKSKEEIDRLILKTEVALEPQAGTQDFTSALTVLSDQSKSLVDDKYFRGALFPMIANYLPAEMELTEEDKVMIVKGVQRKLTGLTASMPVKCYGEKCPFNASCPLYQIGKAPVGEACPIEAMVLDLYTKRYLDEFDVESDNFSEVTTMTMLAATHIMEMRGFMAIGKDEETNSPSGIIKNVVGYTADEDPITQYQEHPGYAIIERAWKWRVKLLESLGATRKDKQGVDTGFKGEFTVSGSAASIKSKIEKFTIVDISEG
jgi:hypothetical protein